MLNRPTFPNVVNWAFTGKINKMSYEPDFSYIFFRCRSNGQAPPVRLGSVGRVVLMPRVGGKTAQAPGLSTPISPQASNWSAKEFFSSSFLAIRAGAFASYPSRPPLISDFPQRLYSVYGTVPASILILLGEVCEWGVCVRGGEIEGGALRQKIYFIFIYFI